METSEQSKKKSFFREFFSLGEVGGYFFRKKDPARLNDFNIRMMHGINKISIVVFLAAVIYLIVKRFIWVNIEGYRAHCLRKAGATEEFPFGEEILVFKVMGKVFALTSVLSFDSINLKCDPEKGVELREQYPSVIPGYHMNKKHWITVLMDGSISDKQILGWIDDSYALVAAGLSRAQKEQLKKR